MNKKILVLFFIVFTAFIGIMNTEAKTIDSVIDNVIILDYSGDLPTQGFGDGGEDCKTLIGDNLYKIVQLGITVLRIAGAIIAIVKGMTLLIPPIMNGDAKALQAAGKRCVNLGIVLLLIGVFPTIINFIGYIFGYDLTCIAS